MKASSRKIRGRNAWEILVDGKVVGEVFRQGTAGGLFMPYRPAVPTGQVDPEDGPVMRVLTAQSTLAGAIEAVLLATKAVMGEATDRVTFIGVGMTQGMADRLAAGIRNRIEGDNPGRRNEGSPRP